MSKLEDLFVISQQQHNIFNDNLCNDAEQFELLFKVSASYTGYYCIHSVERHYRREAAASFIQGGAWSRLPGASSS